MNIFPLLISLGLSTSPITINSEINDDVTNLHTLNENAIISDYNFEIIESQGTINDFYDSAINISPENFHLYENYAVNVEGVLDYCGYPDRDFYYFKLLTDSYVEIECSSVNTIYEFEFAIIGYDYNLENDKAMHTTVDVYDGYDLSCSKSYNGELKAGTYFIYICSQENETSDIEYTFTFCAEKSSRYSCVEIDYLINSGMYGAVWVSDFVPGNSVSIFNATGNVMYYDNLQQGLQYPDYLFNDLKEISNSGWIKYSEYYIFDQVMVHAIHEVFVKLYDVFKNQITQDYNIIADLSLQKDMIEETISIVGTVLGKTIKSAEVNLCIEIVEEISLGILDSYFTLITPSVTLERTEFLLYLEKVADATDFGLSDEEKNNPELIRMHERRILHMPLYYKVNNDDTFSFGSIISAYSNFESLYYNNQLIYTSFDDDYYCRGKLYSIKNYSDLSNAELELIPEHIHNYISIEAYDEKKHKAICECGDFVYLSHINVDHRCIDCNCYLSEHYYKEPYTWINKTCHTATCSCGATETQGHAVVAGGSICLLCRGRADIGFVEILSSEECIYLTDGGSYIRSDGIVILVEEEVDSYLNGTLLFYLRKKELEI